MVVLEVVLQVARLDDLMVFHQLFVTNEPVNVPCLCRTLLLNRVPTRYWKHWKSIEFQNWFSRPWKSIEFCQNVH